MKEMKTLTINGQTYTVADPDAAHINDAAVGADVWSSKNTADKLCPAFAESGSIATCEPVGGYPLEIVSHIAHIQSGEGTPSPDNIRPITGYDSIKLSRTGRNLFGGDALAAAITAKGGTMNTEKGTVSFPSNLGGNNSNWFLQQFKPNTQYTFIVYGKNNTHKSYNLAVWYTETLSNGATYDIITPSAVGVDEHVVYTSRAGKTIKSFGTINYAGMTTLNYDKFGIFEGKVALEEFEPYRGNTFSIDLGQTVYGGTYNWSTGELTMTSVCKTVEVLSSMQTAGYGNIALGQNDLPYGGATATIQSSHYKGGLYDAAYPNYYVYPANANTLVIIDRTHFTSLESAKAYFAEQKAAGTPVQIWYKLKAPTTIQLTPQEILALSNTNNLFSTTGDTEVSGKADPTTVIERLTNAIIALGGNI